MQTHALRVALFAAGASLLADAMPLNTSAARASNATALGGRMCPSAYGPGKHTIEMRIPDAADPTHVWIRSFEVFVPEGMPLSTARPTIMMWHGCGSDPEKFEEESEMDRRVGRVQYYSIYPRGTSSQLGVDQSECISGGGTRCGWNSGFPNPGGCQTPSSPRPDDVQFAELIMAWMENNLCVDMDKLFAVGFSNGGQMTYKLNCVLSQRFAGIVTLGMGVTAGTTPGLSTCQPQRRLPYINFCGSADSVVNCYGTNGVRLADQLDDFANWNQCTGTPLRRDISETSYCLVAQGCPAAQRVEACGIRGLAHCWPNNPGAGDAPCQNQNPANLEASTYLLDFFESLPAGSTLDVPTVGSAAATPAAAADAALTP